MEASPVAVALMSILGSVLVFMIGLLITMIFGMKKEMAISFASVQVELKDIRKELSSSLPI
jgi:hypothetical protein